MTAIWPAPLTRLSLSKVYGRKLSHVPTNEDRRRAYEVAKITEGPVELDNFMQWPHHKIEQEKQQ